MAPNFLNLPNRVLKKTNAFDIPSINESIRSSYHNEDINLEEAAREFFDANSTPFIDLEKTKKHLDHASKKRILKLEKGIEFMMEWINESEKNDSFSIRTQDVKYFLNYIYNYTD